jgi:type VI secretion system protein ImpL
VTQCREIVAGRYPFTRGASVDVPIADFARLFGGGGVFDEFYKQYLASLVDTNRSPWAWREAGGATTGLPVSIPQQFEQIERIRQQFFRPGAGEPELRLTLSPESLDANVQRFVLELNGERLEYAHGPLPRWPVKWPAQASEQVVVTFDTGAGPGASTVYEGPWALFRFLDASSLAPQNDVRFRLDVNAGGAGARLLLDAGSVRNPFAKPLLSRFKCG